MAEPQSPPGFLAKRWQVAKAMVGGMLSHVLKPRTWIMTGAILGGAALLGNFEATQGIANFFHVSAQNPMTVVAGMGKALMIGTLVNAGISGYAKGQEFKTHMATHHTQHGQSEQQHQAERGHQQQQDYGSHSLPTSDFTPQAGLPHHKTSGHDGQHQHRSGG